MSCPQNGMQVYRAISEGIINLADCFFDMEYVEASKGLEIYRQSITDNDRLSVRSSATFSYPFPLPPDPASTLCMSSIISPKPKAPNFMYRPAKLLGNNISLNQSELF